MSVIQTSLDVEPSSVPYPEPRSSAKIRPRYTHRLVTAVVHFVLGAASVTCGSLVLNLHFPGPDMGLPVRYGRDDGDDLDRMDSRFWATWMGLTMIFASVFGFLSKTNKYLISFYMASNVLTLIVATTGVFVGIRYVSRTTRFRDELLHRYNEIPKFSHFTLYPCFVQRSIAESVRMKTVDPMTQQLFDDCIRMHTEAVMAHLPFYCIILACFVLEFINACVASLFTCVGLGYCSSSARSERARRNQAQRNQRWEYLQRQHQVNLQSMSPSLFVSAGPVTSYLVHDLPQDRPPPYSSLSFPQPTASQRPLHGTSPSSAAQNPQLNNHFDAPFLASFGIRPPHNYQNGAQSNDGAEGTEAGLPSYEQAVILSLEGDSTT